jgi:cell shape-determining protein MreD
MFYWRYLLLTGVALLLDATVARRLALGPIRPDFGLAVVVYAGLLGGCRAGLLFGFLMGFIRGCAEPDWLGFDPLLMTLVGFAAACTSSMVNRKHPLTQGGLIAVLLLGHDLLRSVLVSSGDVIGAFALWFRVAPASAILTAVLVPAAATFLPPILLGDSRRAFS